MFCEHMMLQYSQRKSFRQQTTILDHVFFALNKFKLYILPNTSNGAGHHIATFCRVHNTPLRKTLFMLWFQLMVFLDALKMFCPEIVKVRAKYYTYEQRPLYEVRHIKMWVLTFKYVCTFSRNIRDIKNGNSTNLVVFYSLKDVKGSK